MARSEIYEENRLMSYEEEILSPTVGEASHSEADETTQVFTRHT